MNYLVVGPVEPRRLDAATARRSAPIRFGSDTAAYFRDQVQAPFFAHFLKDKGTRDFPEALTFESGGQPVAALEPVAAGKATRKTVGLYFGANESARRRHAAGRRRDRLRQLRLRPGASGAVPPAADPGDVFRRRLEVVDVAGRGSALRRRPRRRAQLGDAAAGQRPDHRRRGGGEALRVDDRHRRRLDRQAHRRLSRSRTRRTGRWPATS